jgi:hypothetical protein
MQRRQCVACNVIVSLIALAALLAGARGWTAAPAAPAAPPPTCDTAEFRAFDFWLGQWEVFLPDGRRAGANRIQASADGCVLTESWSGVGGSSGYSMNFYDPERDAWRQLWVSSGTTIDISGGLEDGAMLLEGKIYYRGTGEDRPFRGHWSVQPDGRVRQFFEEQVEEAWQPWFEGFYAKVVE